MGEARRRKLAGNTEPNPKYRKIKRMTNREIERDTTKIMLELINGSLYKHRGQRFG